MQAQPPGDERADRPAGAWAALARALPGPVTATALSALLDRETDDGPPDVSPDEVLDLLVAAERLVAWAQSLSLAVVGDLVDRLDRPIPPGAPPHPQAPDLSQEVAAELACLLGTSNAAAQAKVALARRLRRLPAVAQALARGEIDLAKARVIAEETDHLDPGTATMTAEQALGGAGRVPPARLRSRCRAAALAADPDATRARRERNRRTGRDVTLQPGRDGLARVAAVLTEDEATDLYARVQHAAAALLAADRAAGHRARPIASARADALLALTRLAATTDARAGTAPERARDDLDVVAGAGHPGAMVGITVPLAALLAGFSGPPRCDGDDDRDDDDGGLAWQLAGLDRFGLGEIAGVGPVSAEEAADACVRACTRALQALAGGERGGRVGVRFIVTDHTGRAVATTTTTYSIPPLLRAAVEARDRTCRRDGCTRPAARCDLDHVVPYPEGSTSLENLAALCRHHHRLKTHAGWRADLDGAGDQTWTSPLGRTYRTGPATWTDPYDPPDLLARPADHDLDVWPDDPGWLDRLTAEALQGLDPGSPVLVG